MAVVEQHCGELSVNGSETLRLNFPGNTQGLPKRLGKTLRPCGSQTLHLSPSLARSADFIFLSQTLLRVTSSLVVSMLSGQIVINPGSFWVAQPGISCVPAPSE